MNASDVASRAGGRRPHTQRVAGRTDWHRQLVQVKAVHLRHLAAAPSVVHERLDGVDVVITGVASNDLNGVVSTAAGATGPAVARARQLVAAHDVPATWLVTDDAVPTEPLPALVEAGCRPELSGWLRAGSTGAVLAHLHPTPARPGAAPPRVEPVRDVAGVEAWLDVAAAVWGDDLDSPAGDRQRRGRLMAELGLAPGAPVQHWVSRDTAGEAVGSASAAYEPGLGVVLLEHLNTVPTARRRGVATALLRVVLELAVERRCPRVVLEPSPDGVPFYDAAGLEAHRTAQAREYYLPW